MPKYRLNYGFLSLIFDAQGAGEVVPVFYSLVTTLALERTSVSFIRRAAIEMCEWNGKNYYFHSRDALAESMIENGLLEVID